MLEIPEEVYIKEPRFVEYDEDCVIDLIRNGLPQTCCRYSIHGVLIDSRVRELLDFTETTGLSLRDAVDLRAKQIKATVSAFPDADNSCLKEYLEFLLVL